MLIKTTYSYSYTLTMTQKSAQNHFFFFLINKNIDTFFDNIVVDVDDEDVI